MLSAEVLRAPGSVAGRRRRKTITVPSPPHCDRHIWLEETRPRGFQLPITTWLRTIDDDVQHQNFGVHTAWRKAGDRDVWQQVVSTATLCWEYATKKKKNKNKKTVLTLVHQNSDRPIVYERWACRLGNPPRSLEPANRLSSELMWSNLDDKNISLSAAFTRSQAVARIADRTALQ